MMNGRKAIICIVILGLIVWLASSFLGHPRATVVVVDAAGRPVVGAIIRGEGLGTKPGPGAYGWGPTLGWGPALDAPKVKTIVTDQAGKARVPYPAHLSEHVETGSIKVVVEHPDFVPNHSERVVAMPCPRQISLKAWGDYFAWRFGRKDPVVMQQGAILKVRMSDDSPGPRDAAMYVQIAGWENEDTNVWIHPESGVAVTRRLPPGTHSIRAVAFDAEDCGWFSDVIDINAVGGQTNEVTVALKRGLTIHGKLDAIVPRPVANGRVTANVRPKGVEPSGLAPKWRAWSDIRADGTFDIGSLPPGEVEIIAICDGYVSLNAKGDYSQVHYPQRYSLETNELAINLEMEPTATLEVGVMDERGRPLKNANVQAYPVSQFAGDAGQSILGADCYLTAELIREGPARWLRVGPTILLASTNYCPMTDNRGRVLIRNLPVEFRWLTVQNSKYILPLTDIEIDTSRLPPRPAKKIKVSGMRQKLRVAELKLVASQTNHTTVSLERRR
jgi:hypothetical protein